MIHPCDRQTDGRAIAYTRYSIYAVARKKNTNNTFKHGNITCKQWNSKAVNVNELMNFLFANMVTQNQEKLQTAFRVGQIK